MGLQPLLQTLPDGPGPMAGQGGKTIVVNGGETAFEYSPGGSGSGDVTGPGSSTDNALVRMDGLTGKIIQNSTSTLSDAGDAVLNSVTVSNTGLKVKDSDDSHSLTIKTTSNLTANRNFTIAPGDAARTLTMGGDINAAGNVTIAKTLTTVGANDLTLTTTGSTDVTLPTTGTLATLLNKVTDLAAPTSAFSMNSQKITNLADGVNSQDAATMANLSAVAAGLLVKNNCNYASTVDVPGTYVGTPTFTLTAAGVGALSIDSATPAAGERILLKNQTDLKQNGIWTVTVEGDGGTAYVLTRATDFNADAEILTGAYTFILSGDTNGGRGYYLNTPATITLDTTDLSFTVFLTPANYVAGSGLTLTGSTFAVGATTGITVAADTVGVDFTAVQAKDAGLDSLVAIGGNGFIARTAADTFTPRSLTAGIGLGITNVDGIVGNPLFDLAINNLTEDTSPVASEDYLLSYDFTASAHKKVKISNIAASAVYPRQVGTSPLEIWYSPAVCSYVLTAYAFTGSYGATNTIIYAVPFYWGGNYTLDRIGMRVTTAVASTVARVGIYNATSKANIYPSTLVVESDEFDCSSTGAKTTTISANLSAGTMYWMVYQCYNNAGVASFPTVRALSTLAVMPVLGTNSSLGSATTQPGSLYVSNAYGAYPATFPAGAAIYVSTTYVPAVFARISA